MKRRVNELRQHVVGLRAVHQDTERWDRLSMSIGKIGVITPIIIAVNTVVDGNYRWEIAKNKGIEEIPTYDIGPTDDATMLCLQMQLNDDAKPMEYKNQIFRILAGDETATLAKIADAVAWKPDEIVSLVARYLTGTALVSLKTGKMSLTNGIFLSRLAQQEPTLITAGVVQKAIKTPVADFATEINAKIREIRENRRKGK